MDYIFLIIGFVLLVKGADFFVDGASDIARFFKIPSLVIGLTIVSIGTSAPEAAVSITAGFRGSNGIALGNVIGSNIFNVAMVLGICALIKPICVDKNIISKDYPFVIASSVLVIFLISDGQVNRIDGLILFILFLSYMAYVVSFALKNKTENHDSEGKVNLVKSVIFSIGGAVGIVYGGEFVVNGATNIAERFGISDAVIGLTVIAIGTSLPELVTSIVAARKGESDIAVGNVVGSSIFNILFILGLSSMLTPIVTDTFSIVDISVLTGMLVFAFVFMKFKDKLERVPAGMLVASYFIYTGYLLIR